jgi:hypothetical protein
MSGLIHGPQPHVGRGFLARRCAGPTAYSGLTLFGLHAYMLLGIVGFRPTTVEQLVNLLVFWRALALLVKRWHDRDKTGWWVLLNIVPLIGFVWTFIECGLMRGTVGPNRCGERSDRPVVAALRRQPIHRVVGRVITSILAICDPAARRTRSQKEWIGKAFV